MKGSRTSNDSIINSGFCNMPTENARPDGGASRNSSKMDVIETTLEVLVLQMKILDVADLPMVSAHLNEAIERLRCEKVALAKKLKI